MFFFVGITHTGTVSHSSGGRKKDFSDQSCKVTASLSDKKSPMPERGCSFLKGQSLSLCSQVKSSKDFHHLAPSASGSNPEDTFLYSGRPEGEKSSV